MLERGARKGSLWYKSQSKSKSLLTLENKRRVSTEVMWLLFPELFLPEIMSLLLSTLHLWFPSLPPPSPSWKTKTPLIIVDYKWETAELHTTTKKKINAWILEEDESFIDFNYVPILHMNKGAYRSFPALSTPTACGGLVFKYFMMLLCKGQTCRTEDPYVKHSQECRH